LTTDDDDDDDDDAAVVLAVRYYLFIRYKYAGQVDGGVNLGPRVAGVVGLCGSASPHGAVATNRSGEKARARADINIEGSGSIKRRNEFQARRTKWRDRKLFGSRPIF